VISKNGISVVVITYNEEKKIERCLRSLSSWTDEIVVVDSFSTDRTVDLCRKYGARVYQHAWPNDYSLQRNRAISYAQNDWVLSLDADEVVTKSLRDEILALLANGPEADAYGIPRQEFFSGRWLASDHFSPQYKVIFYRKSLGTWEYALHERFITRGTTKYLNSPILHDGIGDFQIFIHKINAASSLEAERDVKNDHKKFNMIRLFSKPVERFYGRFIRHHGYKDGIHGLFLACAVALTYFLREFKIYEMNYVAKKQNEEWNKRYREMAVDSDIDRDSMQN